MTEPAILNWRRLSPALTSSGQPSEAQLGEIAALGISDVINLGPHEHVKALPDEAASVAALGMRYSYIPVDFAAPSEDDYAAFVAAMGEVEAAGRTVHVHCIVNARVSAFLYRYRRDAIGEAAARKELESVWQPAGVWAAFIGDTPVEGAEHRYRGRDY
ncbi:MULTISPECIES: protein tyrosine phosphatase family protein [unclassified Sphingomonas]|uniref:protein tyrosine phosphatase family protein n=1 Tax=unclassified Sphingomonas TaxID=196159 RepID=UPI00082EE4A2|nr:MULTISPECIES: protein tyrosine phosphatase family protein [unclassified Sphingomonas]